MSKQGEEELQRRRTRHIVSRSQKKEVTDSQNTSGSVPGMLEGSPGRLDALTERDIISMRGHVISSIPPIQAIFGNQVGQGFRNFLKDSGLDESDVSFRITGRDAEPISRSSRASAKIEITSRDGKKVLRSFLVIKPHNEEEVEATSVMEERGYAPKMLKTGGNPARTNEGQIILKLYDHTSLEDRRMEIDETIGEVYGRSLGRMVAAELSAGILYKIKGPVESENYVDASRRQKGRLPRSHMLLQNFGQESMSPIMLDWSEAVNLSNLSVDQQNIAIEQHLQGVVDSLIVNALRHPAAVHALRSFQEEMNDARVELRLGPDVESTTPSRVSKAFGKAKSPRRILRDVIAKLSRNRETRSEWNDINSDLEKVGRGEHIVPSRDEAELVRPYIHDLISSGLPRHAAEAIVADYSTDEISSRFDDRRRALEGLGFYYDRSDGRVVVSGPEPQREVLVEYIVREGLDRKEMTRYLVSHGGGVTEDVVYRDREKGVIAIKRFKDEDRIDRKGMTLSPVECASLGRSMAMMLTRMVETGVGIPPSRYQDLTFAIGRGESTTSKLNFVSSSRPIANYDISLDQEDRIVDHAIHIARLFNRNLSHGKQAWRVFRETLPHLLGVDPGQVEHYRGLMDSAERKLSARGNWRSFFRESRTVTWEKEKARRTHQEYVDYLSEKEHILICNQRTLDSLQGLTPLVHRAVDMLHEKGMVEDVIGDITHVHFFFRGGSRVFVQAARGDLDVSKGFMAFHLYQCEKGEPRFRGMQDNVVLVPFDNGSIGELSIQPASEIRDMVSPRPFRASLVAGDEHSTGGQNFTINFAQSFFSPTPPTYSEREIERLGEYSIAWGRAEHQAAVVYPERWRGIIRACRSIMEHLDANEKESFVMDSSRTKPAGAGVAGVINPDNPKFFDGNRTERYCSFRNYELMPEVLDGKVDQSYPALRRNASLLFTIEDMLPHVHAREGKLGRHLTREEYESLIREKGVHRVEFAGEKPHEYIDNIEYRRNQSNYVVEMTFRIADGSKRRLIMKYSDLTQEAKTADIMYVLGIETPIIIPCEGGYGLQSIMEGRRFSDVPREVMAHNADRVVTFIGVCAGISGVAGDAHDNNTFYNSRTRRFGRIDLERRALTGSIGDATIAYEFMNLEHSIPEWSSGVFVHQHWGNFMNGVRQVKRLLMDPGSVRQVISILDEMRVDPAITVQRPEMPELERMSRAERHARTKGRYLPEELDEVQRRVLMPAEDVEASILDASRRVEAFKLSRESSYIPHWHVMFMENALRRLGCEEMPFKAEEIMSDKTTGRMEILGMYAVLESVLQMNQHRVIYVEGKPPSASERVAYVIAQQASNSGVFEKGEYTDKLPPMAESYGLRIRDLDEGLDSFDTLRRMVLDISRARDPEASPASSAWDTRTILGSYDSQYSRTKKLESFIIGARRMDKFLKANMEVIASNAGGMGLDREKIEGRIAMDYEVVLREGLRISSENIINVSPHIEQNTPTDKIEIEIIPRVGNDREWCTGVVQRIDLGGF